MAGAAVLVYLGVAAWCSARREEGEFGEALKLHLPAGRTPAASFRALVTIAANPKAAVFAFSFFPQFLPRHRHDHWVLFRRKTLWRHQGVGI